MPEYVLSLSYGKDSLACLGAIKHLGLPLDRIIHAEVWATDTIPADLPPMVEFKKHADKIIKRRYGIEVEHICALKAQGWAEASKHTNQCSTECLKKENTSAQSKDFQKQSALGASISNTKTTALTYEDMFYRIFQAGKRQGTIYGFPFLRGNWCTSLKTNLCSQIVQVERERRHRRRWCNTSELRQTSHYA